MVHRYAISQQNSVKLVKLANKQGEPIVKKNTP